MGLYFEQINEYLKYFPKKQILILFYEEDVMKSPEVGLNKCLTFLGINTPFPFSNLKEKINAEKNAEIVNWINYYIPFFKKFSFFLNKFIKPAGAKKLSPQAYNQLSEYYRNENQKLFQLLGIPNLWI